MSKTKAIPGASSALAPDALLRKLKTDVLEMAKSPLDGGRSVEEAADAFLNFRKLVTHDIIDLSFHEYSKLLHGATKVLNEARKEAAMSAEAQEKATELCNVFNISPESIRLKWFLSDNHNAYISRLREYWCDIMPEKFASVMKDASKIVQDLENLTPNINDVVKVRDNLAVLRATEEKTQDKLNRNYNAQHAAAEEEVNTLTAEKERLETEQAEATKLRDTYHEMRLAGGILRAPAPATADAVDDLKIDADDALDAAKQNIAAFNAAHAGPLRSADKNARQVLVDACTALEEKTPLIKAALDEYKDKCIIVGGLKAGQLNTELTNRANANAPRLAELNADAAAPGSIAHAQAVVSQLEALPWAAPEQSTADRINTHLAAIDTLAEKINAILREYNLGIDEGMDVQLATFNGYKNSGTSQKDIMKNQNEICKTAYGNVTGSKKSITSFFAESTRLGSLTNENFITQLNDEVKVLTKTLNKNPGDLTDEKLLKTEDKMVKALGKLAGALDAHNVASNYHTLGKGIGISKSSLEFSKKLESTKDLDKSLDFATDRLLVAGGLRDSHKLPTELKYGARVKAPEGMKVEVLSTRNMQEHLDKTLKSTNSTFVHDVDGLAGWLMLPQNHAIIGDVEFDAINDGLAHLKGIKNPKVSDASDLYCHVISGWLQVKSATPEDSAATFRATPTETVDEVFVELTGELAKIKAMLEDNPGDIATVAEGNVCLEYFGRKVFDLYHEKHPNPGFKPAQLNTLSKARKADLQFQDMHEITLVERLSMSYGPAYGSDWDSILKEIAIGASRASKSAKNPDAIITPP